MTSKDFKFGEHYLLAAIISFLGLAGIYYLVDLLFYTVAKNFGPVGPTPPFVDYLILFVSFLIMTYIFSFKEILRSKDPYYRYYFVALAAGIIVVYSLIERKVW